MADEDTVQTTHTENRENDDLSSKKVNDSEIRRSKDSGNKRSVNLPLSRIKQIMKMDPDVHMASSESVYLIAKCAEIFVEMLTKEAFTYTSSAKKKTVQKKDINSAVNNSQQLAFLEATID